MFLPGSGFSNFSGSGAGFQISPDPVSAPGAKKKSAERALKLFLEENLKLKND